MPPKANSPEQLQEALDAIEKYGSPYLAAKHLDIGPATLRDRKNIAEKKGMSPSPGVVPEGFALKSMTTLTNLKTGERILQWTKAKAKDEALTKALYEIIDQLKDTLPKVKPVKFNKAKFDSELVSVMPWGDPHCGMYAWKAETGEDFDLDIMERNLVQAVSYLANKSPAERLVMINLGDFYHSNDGYSTFSGTRLDVDSRIHKVIQTGVRAIRTCIAEGLKRHKVVEFITIQGNHDDTLAQFLAVALEAMYENEPRVVIHAQPTRRKYVKFGKVLIGAVHGDKQNENKLAGIMATEQPRWWGETEHRVFFKGHLHHDKVTEYPGMKVEMVRTLAPNDEYAVSGGWLSKHDMKLIVYHKKYGEVDRATCPLEMIQDLRA